VSLKNNESMYNVKEDEDGNENSNNHSFSERKTRTNIPSLKNHKNALIN
jgi:hypothetical protein